MTECLPAELIVQYVDGTLAGDARQAVEAHTDLCTTCRMAVSELAAGSIGTRGRAPSLAAGSAVAPTLPANAVDGEIAPGTSIGRYIVLYRVGRGGMATVYAAFDPELDRKIALKVLHGSGQRDHARLRREARTLAALTHPHVVAVYDVGEQAGRLFIAMEYVEGQTVRAWLAQPRTWQELSPVFLDAARALAAAHLKGIVHRDVKPENLLLDKAGAVRVSDFGLAALAEDVIDAVAGTPAYMAPEQRAGEVSPQSDQYSFCVTLAEALASARGVPRAVTDAVKRGMAEDPQERHPSMEALADVLAIDPAKRRRRIAFGFAVVAPVGVIIAILATRASAEAQCDLAARDAKARWTSERDAVQKAFVATKHAAAMPIFAAVDRELAKYLDAWGAMSTESCERTHVRGDQSATLLDLRARCLDQRLAAASALIDVLAHAKPSVVEGAITAVAGLPSIASCGDTEALTAVTPRPSDPAVAQRADAVDAQLAKAAALQLTGQYDAASAIVKTALPDAIAVDHAPLVAKAQWLAGDLHYRAGDYAAAAAALEASVAYAARGRDDRTATRAFTLLAGIVGYVQGKPDQGMAIALAADAWLARAGRAPEDEAELADIRGLLHDAKGEPLLAKPYYERALELREKLYGADHLIVALSLNNMAGVPHQLGKIAEARALHERALKIREATLGPVAADVAVSLNAIAALDEDEDKLVEAERGFKRALEIWQTVLGNEHPDVAAAHNNLGNLYRRMGNHAAAIRELERALAIWPAEHPHAVTALGNVALIHYQEKDLAKAGETFSTAIERGKKVLGEQHPSIASDLVNRGQVHVEMGKAAEATADFAAAVAMFEATVPAGDRRIAWALTQQGKHLIAQKQIAAATAALARATKILESDKEARPEELAAARFALARAKWEAGARAEAVKLAQSAREHTRDKAVVDAWLRGKR